MITQETGVLNPRTLAPNLVGDYWQKYLRDFGRDYAGENYDEGAEARRVATLAVVEAQKIIPPIYYPTSVPLAAYWGDSIGRTFQRAQYVYDLGQTVQKYSDQTVVWFRQGTYDAVKSPRRSHDRVELEVARINSNGDAGVGHKLQMLSPEKQAASRCPDTEQILYLARIGVVQSQRVVREGGKLIVKDMAFGQNSMPAMLGRISAQRDLESYHQVRQDSRMTLLFGNQEAYSLLEMLAWSATGNAGKNFAEAAKVGVVAPLAPLPELSFLTQPHWSASASVLSDIDDALAANETLLQ